MKQLIIQSLELIQFQKFEYKKVEFGRKTTDITGDNGTGKTTIYSALTWLLFGKDSLGREKFDIKHLLDGVKQDRVDVEVIGTFLIKDDGHTERLTLKRILTEKWDDKTDTYKGDETKCYINDVPSLVGEYNEYVYSIISEENFRILTSVTHFLSMKQEDQREYLCRMAGVREIKDIVSGNEEWEKAIAEMPQKISIEDYEKMIKDALKGYKNDKKAIQPSINALVQSMPEEKDWDVLEERKEFIEANIEEINKRLQSKDKASKILEKKNEAIRKQIEELGIKQHELRSECEKEVFEAKSSLLSKFNEEERRYREAENKISELRLAEKKAEAEMKSHRAEETRLDIEVTDLFNQYMQESQKNFSEGACLMCPLSEKEECKTEAVLSLYKDNIENMRSKFNTSKIATLEAIRAKGKAKKAEYEEEKRMAESFEKSMAAILSQLEREELRFAGMTKPTVVSSDSEETKIRERYQKQIVELQEKVEVLKNGLSKVSDTEEAEELKSRRDTYTNEVYVIIRELASRDQILRIRKQIEERNEAGKEIARMIVSRENLLNTLTEIKRAVIDDAAQRINAMFQVTHWVTSIQQKNGDWKDVCIPTINGVSISLNTAARINVGLDICNAIGNYLGISVPCFIDNRESVNEIVDLGDTQIINLRVAPKGTPLTIQ